MKARRIGLVGCGTIGLELATAIDHGAIANAVLHSVFDEKVQKSHYLVSKLNTRPVICEDSAELLASDFDLLVEAASQEAVNLYILKALELRRDVMLMSVGALADIHFFEKIKKLSSSSGASLYIPSGAIAGLDAIRAVKNLIESVTLTTTKNPKALAGAPFFQARNLSPEMIVQKTKLFEGSAAEAVKLFPANVNVAAAISLAGIGPERTAVKIIADPASKTNMHRICIRGSFGEINIEVNNVPSPTNPKTSYLAVLSAIECLRSICETGIKVGS